LEVDSNSLSSLSSASGRGIVLVTELFPPDVGGTPELFDNIYRRLTGPVTVLTNDRPTPVGRLREGTLQVVRLPMVGGHWGVTSPASVWRYWRMVSELRTRCRMQPVVFHCARALPEGFAALCATRLSRSSRYVCWTHGEELHYMRTSRELSLLLSSVHKASAAVIANSRNTARQLQALGVPDDKIHVVYPGVDVDRFAHTAGRIGVRREFAADHELLLLTVGRLQRRKGHDLAIEALASLRGEKLHVRYLIVGDGDERARLEGLVDRCGVRDQVTFAGSVPAADLPRYYAAADIFVHPNRVDDGDAEGFGMVFLEAAAAALPVIGGDSGGVPEAIEAGATGLLVTGTAVGELVSAIRTLAGDAALRRRMGELALSRVRRQFTWERAAAQVAAIHAHVSSD